MSKKGKLQLFARFSTIIDLYPVSPEWTRSEYSMLIAWDMHNKIYNIMHNERCQHVDFNNGDELSRVADYYKRAVNGVRPYVFGYDL